MFFIKVLIFIAKPIVNFYYKLKLQGMENYIYDKPFVLVSNHKSMMDPIVLFVNMPRKMKFMAKKELFDNKILAFILRKVGAFPVNRGKNDIAAIKTAMKVLKDGEVLGIFPQGTRVEDGQQTQAKTGAFLIASKCNVPVLPVSIKGNYKFRSQISIKVLEPYYFEDKKYTTEELSEISNDIFNKILDYAEVK